GRPRALELAVLVAADRTSDLGVELEVLALLARRQGIGPELVDHGSRLLTWSSREQSSVRRHRRVDGVVLPERIALPVVREEDAPQVGMTLENDPEHVVALALHPVGASIERGHRRTARLARGQ